ncbi:MAG TPA: 3-hydroxyanthranilate 3,4-dioxygenase, partial [Thermoanaerobaculia bacterium]|nr:3-hydroxyanthranilate 3,4-dioxygenase [Thermoanaerobaculia bacterium]
MLPQPIDFQKWIDEHRHLLQPPVCNKKVFENDEFIVMVVGGPNARRDYHLDEGPELFYQLEGEMVLKTIQDGKVVDIPIRAGQMFLLPSNVPHSPQRMADSVGLVVERKRLPEEMDGLQWYCDNCTNLLYEEFFPLRDIEKDLPVVFEHFYSSEER